MRSMKTWISFAALLAVLGGAPPTVGAADGDAEPYTEHQEATDESSSGYEKGDVLREAEEFFGAGAAGLAGAIEKAFKERGHPNAYVKGEEASGAIGVGVRYGQGTLHYKGGGSRKVYWKGPSVGFDFGGNASKAFILIYNAPVGDTLYQRYPGVDGSAYFVGGVGLNYNQSGDTVLAPIRFGVGLRLGASIGYIHLSKERSWIPF